MVREGRQNMGTDAMRCVDAMVRACGSSLLATFIGNKVKLKLRLEEKVRGVGSERTENTIHS